MALDAARQARRAAEAAEAASEIAAAVVSTRRKPRRTFLSEARSPDTARRRPAQSAEARLRIFNERAERLLARVQAV
jgi:hypothetical protein